MESDCFTSRYSHVRPPALPFSAFPLPPLPEQEPETTLPLPLYSYSRHPTLPFSAFPLPPLPEQILPNDEEVEDNPTQNLPFTPFSFQRQTPVPFSELRVPSPTMEQIVADYQPQLGHPAKFLEHFPPPARTQIIDTMNQILEAKSPGAPKSRESIVVEAPGISMGRLKESLVETLPWIKIKYPDGGPCEDTLRHLMSPPHQGRLSASSYQGIVPAKLALGQNNKQNDIPFAHVHNATSLMLKEFVIVNSGTVWAMDGMCRLKLGSCATDHRHKVFRFISESSMLEYDDHDYTGGYKACTYGVMTAVHQLGLYDTYVDTHGQTRIAMPTKQKVTLHIRFNKFGGLPLAMTVLEHVQDLQQAVTKVCNGTIPANVFGETDHGAEANFHTEKAHHAYGMFFKENKMGVLIIGGPASNDSRRNPIERAFAEPKKAVNGLVVSETVGLDTLPPDQQSDLTIEETRAKETELFTIFGETLVNAWAPLKYGGNNYSVRYSLPEAINTNDAKNKMYKEHLPVLKNKTHWTKRKDLTPEVYYQVISSVLKGNEILIRSRCVNCLRRWPDATCESCASIPLERRAFADYLHRVWFGSLPPARRAAEDDRFMGYHELLSLTPEERAKAVNKLPREYDDTDWRRCAVPSCYFWSDTVAGCDRHRHLVHPEVKDTSSIFDKFFICRFKYPRPRGNSNVPEGEAKHCGKRFNSKLELDEHSKTHETPRQPAEVAAEPVLPYPPLVSASSSSMEIDLLSPPTPVSPVSTLLISSSPMEVDLPAAPTQKLTRKHPRRDVFNDLDYEDVPTKRCRVIQQDLPSRSKSKGLKETFHDLLDNWKSALENGSATPKQTAKKVVKILADKGFIRSDSVETAARKTARQIRAAPHDDGLRLAIELIQDLKNLPC